MRPGHRARKSRGRLSPLTSLTLVVLAIAMSAVAGGFAYLMPTALVAWNAIAQPAEIPSPSAASILFSPSPSSSPVQQQQGAFTVLLLGSDDDSKFSSDHVLTQSMILVRVLPATKEVTMLSIPRDLYVHLSTGGFGKIDGA
jgi:anionic cell wall polymer biosynthesis LytR-Cps2A-Psr (LCP) family protein